MFYSDDKKIKPPSVRSQHINDACLNTAGMTLTIRREDELHPVVSGNKFRKLKYNLLVAKQQGYESVLTFGGAYSNHIVATACAAQQSGLPSIGVIRGDELAHDFTHSPDVLFAKNATLKHAHDYGMQFYFVSRQQYREKQNHSFLTALRAQFGDVYLIPEGGSNTLAVQGCQEILTFADITEYDVVCCPVGTGGTLAGLIRSVQLATHEHTRRPSILGFAALAAPSLTDDVARLVQESSGASAQEVLSTNGSQVNWQVNFDYHFGGYAKVTDELVGFINRFNDQQGIPLDPIYTGKMLYGIYDLAAIGYFAEGTRILAIHTGGLQGIAGMNIQRNAQGKSLIRT